MYVFKLKCFLLIWYLRVLFLNYKQDSPFNWFSRNWNFRFTLSFLPHFMINHSVFMAGRDYPSGLLGQRWLGDVFSPTKTPNKTFSSVCSVCACAPPTPTALNLSPIPFWAPARSYENYTFTDRSSQWPLAIPANFSTRVLGSCWWKKPRVLPSKSMDPTNWPWFPVWAPGITTGNSVMN